MGVLRRVLAVVLALISLSLGVHFVVGEIYGAYLPEPHLVWDYLNWLTAFGVVVILVYHYRRKRSLDRQQQNENVSFNYLSTNLTLFAAMFLTFWFFANWFEELSMNDQSAGEVVGFVWISFNAAFVILSGLTAWQLWRDGSDWDEETGEDLSQPDSLLISPAGLAVEGQPASQASSNVPRSVPGSVDEVPGGAGRDRGE